jgi:outer membrane protein assembly factor BamB
VKSTHESFAVRPRLVSPYVFPYSFFPRRLATAIDGAGLVTALTTTVIAGLLLIAGGCQVATKPPGIVAVPAGAFVQKWSAPIPELKGDPCVNLYLRGSTLYAYARSNQVYGFSAAGGKLIFSDQVVGPTSPLRAPTLLPDNKVIFPAADTLEEYDRNGRRLRSLPLHEPTHSSGVAVGYTFYVGLDSPTGGRLAALDLTPRVPTEVQVTQAKRLNVSLEAEINRISTKWEVLTIAGIQSTPAFFQGVVYAGTLDGKVWAINEQGSGIWSLPDGSHVFRAAGPIHADLKIDDFGLYVASEDGSLYCVDRGTGRVKWTYFAGTPLDVAPVVTPSVVYQYVPGTGVVAIDKRPLGFAKAKWINAQAVSVLSEDSHYLYALENDGYLMALDKTDGHRVFRGATNDLSVFATDEGNKVPTIYAATKDGTIIATDPVLRPGTMGVLVMDTIPAPFQICLQ